MLILSVITMILYGANKYYHYAPYITYHGLIRCLCFFFMGNLFQQKGYLQTQNPRKDVVIGTTALLFSLILFYWHIHEERFVLHIFLYYVVNFASVYAFIYLSKSLNSIKSRLITLISIGTMLIFGLHRMMIGVINFIVEKTISTSCITYDWHECLIIALAIEFTIIPFIIYRKKYKNYIGKQLYKGKS